MPPSTSTNPTTPAKSDPIIIIGAGIFGLSTAIHLLQRDYTNVTVFDKQPYEKTHYSYFEGCDAASADTNKIIRSAYGSQTEYQGLSTEALGAWRRWNAQLANSGPASLPKGLSRGDSLFINNGNLSLTTKDELPEFEVATIRNMENAGHYDTQLITTETKHVKLANEKGMVFAIDPFHRQQRGKHFLGVLDTTGGMLNASKACIFALHKARSLGAKLVLGAGNGEFKEFINSSSPPNESSGDTEAEIIGIRTLDNESHYAAKVIIACGGYTPSILPQLDGICETTAGSVAMLKIPRHSKLWERLAAEHFPTYTWNIRDGKDGGIYGFPRDEEGWLKIGYRGTKYTNPKHGSEEKERSVPVTRWTSEKIEGIPRQAFKVLQRFLDEYLPELGEEGITISVTRLCWYTDSFDNHFVIDHVPGMKNVMVATGGSGHAFKYLPVIGGYVVDVMEGKEKEEVVGKWRWRTPKEGEEVVNVLMEGSDGLRALKNVELVTAGDGLREGVQEGGRARL